jgi:hypothetical protein
MIINCRWVLKDVYGYSDVRIKDLTDEDCEKKVVELQNGEVVSCRTCNKEITRGKSWTLAGRDYERPLYFCSDSCRMVFPFQQDS